MGRQAIIFMVIFSFLLVVLSVMITTSVKSVPRRSAASVYRVGMVVGIREDKIEQYKKLHADNTLGVRDLLAKYHIHNFSIFLQRIDGKWYEFGYYEYTGSNYKDDMALMEREPRTIDWLKICDPLQVPLPGSSGWTIMERVYYNQ